MNLTSGSDYSSNNCIEVFSSSILSPLKIPRIDVLMEIPPNASFPPISSSNKLFQRFLSHYLVNPLSSPLPLPAFSFPCVFNAKIPAASQKVSQVITKTFSQSLEYTKQCFRLVSVKHLYMPYADIDCQVMAPSNNNESEESMRCSSTAAAILSTTTQESDKKIPDRKNRHLLQIEEKAIKFDMQQYLPFFSILSPGFPYRHHLKTSASVLLSGIPPTRSGSRSMCCLQHLDPTEMKALNKLPLVKILSRSSLNSSEYNFSFIDSSPSDKNCSIRKGTVFLRDLPAIPSLCIMGKTRELKLFIKWALMIHKRSSQRMNAVVEKNMLHNGSCSNGDEIWTCSFIPDVLGMHYSCKNPLMIIRDVGNLSLSNILELMLKTSDKSDYQKLRIRIASLLLQKIQLLEQLVIRHNSISLDTILVDYCHRNNNELLFGLLDSEYLDVKLIGLNECSELLDVDPHIIEQQQHDYNNNNDDQTTADYNYLTVSSNSMFASPERSKSKKQQILVKQKFRDWRDIAQGKTSDLWSLGITLCLFLLLKEADVVFGTHRQNLNETPRQHSKRRHYQSEEEPTTFHMMNDLRVIESECLSREDQKDYYLNHHQSHRFNVIDLENPTKWMASLQSRLFDGTDDSQTTTEAAKIIFNSLVKYERYDRNLSSAIQGIKELQTKMMSK